MRNILALTWQTQQKYSEAKTLFEKNLEVCERAYGPGSANFLTRAGNFGVDIHSGSASDGGFVVALLR
jgi:hypothetical protein